MQSYNKYFLGNKFKEAENNLKYLPPLKYLKNCKLEEHFACPLCKKSKYLTIGNIDVDLLISYWVERYGFNPIADDYKHKVLEKRYCENCGLYFYNYHFPDSDEMYNLMSEKSNYYPNFRQVFGIATEIIEKFKPKSLLEIGCGDGSFLQRIQHLVPNAVGSEYNPHAIKLCQEKGLNVVDTKIENLKTQFDVVCSFEVLEHVYDSLNFLKQNLKLLKTDGKLIIGTPDPEGVNAYIAKFQCNLPPHHHHDFSKKCFEWLAKKLNLKIVYYQKTELDYRHYASYVKEITGKELSQPDISGFYEAQKRLTGASHLVVFEKL